VAAVDGAALLVEVLDVLCGAAQAIDVAGGEAIREREKFGHAIGAELGVAGDVETGGNSLVPRCWLMVER
jgi:hypothetical protein